MALPSGNFTSTKTGRLVVRFSGQFTFNSGGDFGDGGTWNITLRCYVGSGGSRSVAYIDFRTNNATLEVDYVGGSGNLAVGMEFVSRTFDGPGTVYAKKLRVACTLFEV